MTKQEEAMILAIANGYQQKFYLNPKYQGLPSEVKREIKEICVRFTEEIGGLFELSFDKEGALQIKTYFAEGDIAVDEIGAELLVKEFQREKEELFRQLEMYYSQQ